MRRLLLVCLLVGCGSDGDGNGPISADEFDQAFADAVCTFYVNCGLLEDRAQCAQVDLDGVTSAASLAGVEMGTVIYDPDAAAACLSRFSSCERAEVFGLTSAARACSDIFHGSVGAGGTCTNRVQCASNSCDLACDPETCCEGTCVGDSPTFVYVKLGEACGNSRVCTDSRCDRTTSTCTELEAVGSACGEDLECESLRCTNDICVATVATGGTCETDEDCTLFSDVCSSATKQCAPLGLTGDSCVDDGDCSPIYACGSAGTCQLGPRLGDPCDSNCIDQSYCDPSTSTCVTRKADGATCTDDGECDGTCTAQGLCATYPLCI